MKEQIVEKSLKEFLEHGIRSMTMQKLASAMGISTKTMYKFFADKEALLEACLNVLYSGLDRDVKGIVDAEPNPVDFICTLYAKSTALDFGVNHLFYHDLNHYYPELQDKVITRNAGVIGEILTGALQLGIDEGYFLPYLKPPVVLRALSVLYTSVTRFDTYKNFNLTPGELVKHTIDIYLRGICTDKGIAVINRKNESTQ
ncbi:MAG TPA: TetR/AcrR family transcriptional regulator [Mucilaginibacter sp.]|nr:TetR/AcrR family transcriptional regulator [Mucilaginibacter sp.]